MTESKCFLDTNLLVYLYSTDPKSATIENLINAHFGEICLSIQVLNELYSVLTRKNLTTKEEAQSIVNDLIDSYSIYCIDERCIKRAIGINIKYHFSYWDSLIIAAALEVGCTTLYSEDLQHNQLIEDALTILNPFMMSK
ncbi:MAG: PIN domain-containing protein [Hormoscilla sp.]